MAVTGLLQFTPGLGIRGSQKSCQRHKFSFGRNELHLPATSLSSLTSGHDLFTHHVSESIKKPICSISLRKNALSCRSSLSLGPNVSGSCLKIITSTLARSYNFLQCNPSIINLATAVGIVVFAIWGLEPLVRSSRNIFLHKNDNNWRKSTNHYVLTSYLQPALLWMGAMLLCRALDPVHMPTDASHLVKLRVLNFVRSLSTVLSLAYCSLCAIQQAQKVLMNTSDPSEARNMGFQFAGKAVHTAVWVAAVSLFMELLGFSTQKWLTAGGLGTVLLTIAGREIFTNFLSSAMIHATRPFVLNEWIQTKIDGYEVSGTVEHVGWWSPTIIRGEDREAVHIPNHKFTMNVVRNLSQKTHWRIKTHLAINHLDVDKINNIVADMRKVLAKNPQVEQQKLHRRVFLDSVDPENQALLILVSCFVKTSRHEEYYRIKEIILLDLLRVISHHGARLATPIRTIQRMPITAEMENMSFSESGLYRGRPFLLTEPAKPPRSSNKPKAKSASETSNAGVQDDKQAAKSSASISDVKKPGPKEEQHISKASDVSDSISEENIVLGVALGGSKRTLLIDDDHHPNPPPPVVEEKEAAANLSSSGKGRANPSVSDKDED